VFGIVFLWLHYVGPSELVGQWVRHQPIGALASAAIALFVVLIVLWVAVRKG
jgi:hypothetical protein